MRVFIFSRRSPWRQCSVEAPHQRRDLRLRPRAFFDSFISLSTPNPNESAMKPFSYPFCADLPLLPGDEVSKFFCHVWESWLTARSAVAIESIAATARLDGMVRVIGPSRWMAPGSVHN